MTKIVILASLIFTITTFAEDDCLCWIDAKTGKPVPTIPIGAFTAPNAERSIDFSSDHQSNPKTGQNYVRVDERWIDSATGKCVPTIPIGAFTAPKAARSIDFSSDHQSNPKTGQNYVRVPCPEESSASITGAVETASAPAAAPANDLFQVGVGYNFMRTAQEDVKNLNGFQVSGFYNVNSWLALGGEFSGLYGSHTQRADNDKTDCSDYTVDTSLDRYLYLFGPQVTFRPFERVKINSHVLVGGVHDENDVSYSGDSVHSSADAFAMAIGAGVDVQVTRHFSIGPWLDYAPTAFSSPGHDWQNNWRAGVAAKVSF